MEFSPGAQNSPGPQLHGKARPPGTRGPHYGKQAGALAKAEREVTVQGAPSVRCTGPTPAPECSSPRFTRKVSDREKHSPGPARQSYGQCSCPSLVVERKERKRATGRPDMWPRPSGSFTGKLYLHSPRNHRPLPADRWGEDPDKGEDGCTRSDVGVT